MKRAVITFILISIAALAQQPDSQLLTYINGIRAIDNHAHVFARDIPNDNGYDQLRCGDLPPGTGLAPANLRFGSDVQEAWKALYGFAPATADEAGAKREAELADLYKKHPDPDWAPEQAGIDVVLANRQFMTPGLKPPHFRWVPYDDPLLFPLDNSALKTANPDRKALFTMADDLRARYWKDAGLNSLPPTLTEYLDNIVTSTLQKQKAAGALAIKFEAAYLRQLNFAPAKREDAEVVYQRYAKGGTPSDSDYKILQDFLFRYVAAVAGRFGLPLHIHTGTGCGEFFDDAGSDPMLLESVLNDPNLRSTNFVLLHGATPFQAHITTLIWKPNVYVDTSFMEYIFSPQEFARFIRPWLEVLPEHVIFGTDSGPGDPTAGWEETTVMGSRRARQGLAIALTGMVNDGVITMPRAKEIADRLLRGNAAELYQLR